MHSLLDSRMRRLLLLGRPISPKDLIDEVLERVPGPVRPPVLGLEIGNELLDLFHDRSRESRGDGMEQIFDVLQRRLPVLLLTAGYLDLVMERRLDLLAGRQELLIKLFAGPETGKRDPDILVGIEP